MITLNNMIFANPAAYSVFPNIMNPNNTDMVEKARFAGTLVVTDSTGHYRSYSHTNLIDFEEFTGVVDIDQYTNEGAIKLGRWGTDKLGITHYEMEIVPNTYYFSNQAYYNYPLHATQYEVVTIGDKEVSRKEVDLGMMSRESEDWLECNWGSADNEVPLDVHANPNSSHRKGIVYLSEPNHDIEEIPVYIYQDGTAVWTLDQISHATIIDAIPAEGYDSGTDSTDIHFSIEYTSDTIEGVSIIPVENMEDFSGDYDWFTISNLGDRGMGRAAFYFDLHVEPNTNTESRSIQVPISWEWYRTEDTPDNVFEGMNHVVGTSYLTLTQLGVPEPIYEAPYTPGWSIGFSMTNQGTAANKITNGIEVLQTGSDPDHDDNNFFGYTNELYEGERFYSATIQVTGLPEGYTIIGIHGWDGVTITQDGEYTLPEFTWTNSNSYPEGTSIPYQEVPSLRFANGTEADVMFDTPITIVITAVQSMEDTINEHMVLWYDIKRQGATNENMASNPTLRDLSGNGHDITCYNFAWTEESGISTTAYPNALVFDGVDDYCINLNVEQTQTDFTVIFKATLFDESYKVGADNVLFSKGDKNFDGFYIYANNYRNKNDVVACYGNRRKSVYDVFINGGVNIWTFGYFNESIMGIEFWGVHPVLCLGAMNGNKTSVNPERFETYALYYFVLFDRTLTTEEIEWVKTNLIETEQ